MANSSDTEAPFLDLNLNLSITNGIVSSKIYDKRDDFNFNSIPISRWRCSSLSFLWCIHFMPIHFARVCSDVDDFNNRNLFLTAKLLKQGYRYHKIRKAFSKFYHRNWHAYFEDFVMVTCIYMYLHNTALCFGAKIISQGIILALKVKVPCLIKQ